MTSNSTHARRRRYPLLISVAALCTTVFIWSGANAPQAETESFSCLDPRPLDQLTNSFGINTHLHQGWQYSDAKRTVAALKDLGIDQIREAFIGLGNPLLEYAAGQGIQFLFFVSPSEHLIASLEAWEKKFPGSILGIEGPNEVNNWPVTFRGKTGVSGAKEFQQWLHTAIRASPILKSVPVIALTSWPVFPNKSDIGNIHVYSRTGRYIYSDIQRAIAYESLLNPPAKIIWLTEAGYHSRIGEDYFEGVSEAVQAKMLMSVYLDAFAQNVERTFLYQLLDQYTDPNDEQAFFGLVDLHWRPKPSFLALKTMIAFLKQQTVAGAETVRPVSIKVAGLPTTARKLLFQAAPNTYLLALWNEPAVWDKSNNLEVENPISTVTLALERSAVRMRVYDPLVGLDAIDDVSETGHLDIALDDHPVFVAIESRDQDGCK